ncbi:MAG: hypothetical protein ACFCUQ_13340 [Kiloniellales bacterium]
MQLKLKRTQRAGGLMGGKVYFALDARADLTEEEAHNVRKYKLGSEVIYNSEASRKHLQSGAAALATGNVGGLLKSSVSLAMSRLSLNVTVESLTKGHHIECKDLEELLGAEEAIRQACENVKTYLAVAATFDGREEVVEY